jgi:hypothetical protein
MIPAGEAAVLRESPRRIADLYRARGDVEQATLWEQRARSALQSGKAIN